MALRKYYPDDEMPMRFADFIESAGQLVPSVMFSYKISFDCPDGNKGCWKNDT